jgi:hypothetical protein
VTALSPSLRRALRLVSLASRLVPTRLRDEWRAEWEGELTAAEAAGATSVLAGASTWRCHTVTIRSGSG